GRAAPIGAGREGAAPPNSSTDLTMMSAATHLRAGCLIGPYRIEAALGAGGMGEVYRAHDTRLKRTVAIKVLPRDQVADPARKRRFLLEARAASALNHPNIVALYDISSDRGVDYLVLEYVRGRTLKEMCKGEAFSVDVLVHCARQTAAALAAAHAA